MKSREVLIDFGKAGAALNIRRHALGQGGIDDRPLSGAVVEKVRQLRPQTVRMFVQEYFQMMSGPGEYQWATVDAQLRSIAATRATPVLSLCMKPKCLFPVIDHTITAPNDWGHWEEFIFAMTTHFVRDLKMPGMWYEVGNEVDIGELGAAPYKCTPENYAEFYSRTAKAVLKADPRAQVGGPALANSPRFHMPGNPYADWAPRFAKAFAGRNVPLHFFSFHRYSLDAEDLGTLPTRVKELLRSLGEPWASAKTCLNEWNMSWVCSLQFGEYAQAAYIVDAISRWLDTELDVSNYYMIEDMALYPEKWQGWFSAAQLEKLCRHWNSAYRGLHMFVPTGESAASFVAFQMLYDMEGLRVPVERPSRNLGVLASREERACRILLWNYHHEEHAEEQVKIVARNLGKGPLVQRFWRLGGIKMCDLEGVMAMHAGGKRLVDEQAVAGEVFEREYRIEPYNVGLIELGPAT